MAEFEPTPEAEATPSLDRERLIDGLQEAGMDAELEDWDGLDDNDILGNIATLALMYDLDIDDLYQGLGIEVEQNGDLS